MTDVFLIKSAIAFVGLLFAGGAFGYMLARHHAVTAIRRSAFGWERAPLTKEQEEALSAALRIRGKGEREAKRVYQETLDRLRDESWQSAREVWPDYDKHLHRAVNIALGRDGRCRIMLGPVNVGNT